MMGAAEPAREQLEDRAVRAWTFYTLLALIGLVVFGAHRLQAGYSYLLNATDPGSGRPLSAPLRHGSYGAFLARSPAAVAAQRPRPIVLLGNSVYQACGIPERMQQLANDRGEDVEFFNLAQTGSGIHDHFVQMLQSFRFEPQLIVVVFANLAFTPAYGASTLPRFRTDADQMLFDGDGIRRAPLSFLRREFTFAAAADSLVSTVFPWKRLDPIVRIDVDRWLYWQIVDTLALDPVAFRLLFHLPDLNLAQDWLGRRGSDVTNGLAVGPYPQLEAIVTEFLQVCGAAGVPVLFLRQETSAGFGPDVLPAIQKVCATFPTARVADLQSAFRRKAYIDQIHPADEERQGYAQRHYEVITAAFRELTAPANARRDGK